MALAALKADSEAAQATAVAAPPAADEGGAPPNAALSLACIGDEKAEAADDVPLRRQLPGEPWRLGAARCVSQ